MTRLEWDEKGCVNGAEVATKDGQAIGSVFKVSGTQWAWHLFHIEQTNVRTYDSKMEAKIALENSLG